jgi:hypothetical protein
MSSFEDELAQLEALAADAEIDETQIESTNVNSYNIAATVAASIQPADNNAVSANLKRKAEQITESANQTTTSNATPDEQSKRIKPNSTTTSPNAKPAASTLPNKAIAPHSYYHEQNATQQRSLSPIESKSSSAPQAHTKTDSLVKSRLPVVVRDPIKVNNAVAASASKSFPSAISPAQNHRPVTASNISSALPQNATAMYQQMQPPVFAGNHLPPHLQGYAYASHQSTLPPHMMNGSSIPPHLQQQPIEIQPIQSETFVPSSTTSSLQLPPANASGPNMSLPPHLAQQQQQSDADAISESTSTTKEKKYIRTCAGQIWEDPSLAEWPENDFRLFCGDLGNEVTDTVLASMFSKRYPSFAKAKVVRDSKKGKTKGFG